MSLFLPDLLYCNRQKTIDLLSVLVSDLVTEYSLKEYEDKDVKKGVDLGVSAANIGKIVARYQSGDSRSVEKEGIVKLPTSSLFVDLYSILKSQNKVQRLVGFDDKIISQLNVGEFIELDGTFSLSPIEAAISSLFDALKRFQAFIADDPQFDQFDEIVNAFSSKKATIIIKPYNDVKVSFVSTLKTISENMHDEIYELEGEFTVFGRIRRIIPEGKKVDLIKFLPGKLRMKKEELMKMVSSLSDLQDNGLTFDNDFNEDSFELDGPVIEIRPIAIYQAY